MSLIWFIAAAILIPLGFLMIYFPSVFYNHVHRYLPIWVLRLVADDVEYSEDENE